MDTEVIWDRLFEARARAHQQWLENFVRECRETSGTEPLTREDFEAAIIALNEREDLPMYNPKMN